MNVTKRRRSLKLKFETTLKFFAAFCLTSDYWTRNSFLEASPIRGCNYCGQELACRSINIPPSLVSFQPFSSQRTLCLLSGNSRKFPSFNASPQINPPLSAPPCLSLFLSARSSVEIFPKTLANSARLFSCSWRFVRVSCTATILRGDAEWSGSHSSSDKMFSRSRLCAGAGVYSVERRRYNKERE